MVSTRSRSAPTTIPRISLKTSGPIGIRGRNLGQISKSVYTSRCSRFDREENVPKMITQGVRYWRQPKNIECVENFGFESHQTELCLVHLEGPTFQNLPVEALVMPCGGRYFEGNHFRGEMKTILIPPLFEYVGHENPAPFVCDGEVLTFDLWGYRFLKTLCIFKCLTTNHGQTEYQWDHQNFRQYIGKVMKDLAEKGIKSFTIPFFIPGIARCTYGQTDPMSPEIVSKGDILETDLLTAADVVKQTNSVLQALHHATEYLENPPKIVLSVPSEFLFDGFQLSLLSEEYMLQ